MALRRGGGAAPSPSRYGGSVRYGTAPWFQWLTGATALSVFALVVLGGVVRVTGSGLGCPDWPLCYGGFLPPAETKAVIEFSHRVVASFIVGPLIIAVVAAAWLAYRHEKWLTIPATISLILLVIQALIGGWTVLSELPGHTVMLHLAVGQGLLGGLALMTVVAWRGPLELQGTGWTGGMARHFPPLAVASAAALYVLLLSGSLVTNTEGATTACRTWPLCNGSFFPSAEPHLIHMTHRYAALLIGLFVLYSLHLGFRGRTQPLEIRILSMAAVTLLVLQVLVGAGAVWMDFSAMMRGLHLGLASATWGAAAALACLAYAPTGAPRRGSSAPEGRRRGGAFA